MKIAIIVGIVVVLLGGGYLVVSKSNTSSTNEDIQSVEVEKVETVTGDVIGAVKRVSYTKTGFVPKTISVSKGETVMFVDEGGGRMWVSSDNHPAHTNYPGNAEAGCSGAGFDQCEIGESYSFTFNEAGTHKYHNHIRSADGGTIIVE